MSETIYLSYSMINLSNSIVFDGNDCKQLISLVCEHRCYLVLLGSANLTLYHNYTVDNQLIHVPIRSNHPYSYCLFQYYLPVNNQYEDFQINLLFIWERNYGLAKGLQSMYQLTSHCKWAPGAAFFIIIPSIVNKAIIRYKYGQMFHQFIGIHTTVCHCPPSSHYNCSVDQLGPVYPSENLTVDLSLPYNKEKVGIMYVETYNDNLPKSACTIFEHDSIRHTLH